VYDDEVAARDRARAEESSVMTAMSGQQGECIMRVLDGVVVIAQQRCDMVTRTI
jgi:hypothetical protein